MSIKTPIFWSLLQETAWVALQRISRFVGACSTVLLFAACTTVIPTTTTPLPDLALAQPRTYHPNIEMEGRLSIQYRQGEKDEALHGNFTWAETPGHVYLTLLSPLGQTIAEITITPSETLLHQAGKPARAAPDPDSLVAEALGWPLPLKGMREWLQGFATAANGTSFSAGPQASAVTTVDGWRIRYVSWQDLTEPAAGKFPKRIDLERSTQQAGDVSVRVVIDTVRRH